MEHFNTMAEEYPVPGDASNPIEATEAIEPVEPEESGEPIAATPDQPVEAGEPGTENGGIPLAGIQSGSTDASTPMSEADLPPEAQGETNGGPLGCCLGATIGLVLSLFVAIFGRLYIANPLVDTFHNALLVLILLRVAMGIVTIGGAIVLGIVGWKAGKKLFREYEQPVVPVKQKRRRRKARIRPREA